MDVEQSVYPSIKAGDRFYGVFSNAAVLCFASHLVDLSKKPKELKLSKLETVQRRGFLYWQRRKVKHRDLLETW